MCLNPKPVVPKNTKTTRKRLNFQNRIKIRIHLKPFDRVTPSVPNRSKARDLGVVRVVVFVFKNKTKLDLVGIKFLLFNPSGNIIFLRQDIQDIGETRRGTYRRCRSLKCSTAKLQQLAGFRSCWDSKTS
jgi:hypothetical protein